MYNLPREVSQFQKGVPVKTVCGYDDDDNSYSGVTPILRPYLWVENCLTKWLNPLDFEHNYDSDGLGDIALFKTA